MVVLKEVAAGNEWQSVGTKLYAITSLVQLILRTGNPYSNTPKSSPTPSPQARNRPEVETVPLHPLLKSLKAARIVSGAGMLYHKERPSPGTHREHSRPILEGAGEARNPCVVWQAGVTVARRQRRVQECLLRGVMSLCLVLLGLGQGCGWGWGGGISTAELCEVTCDRSGLMYLPLLPPHQCRITTSGFMWFQKILLKGLLKFNSLDYISLQLHLALLSTQQEEC